MQAFHGQQAIKDKFLRRVAHHRELDNLIQGSGWENGKGCAIGCTLEAYEHKRYPDELGLPVWVAHLEDRIFEALPVEEAKLWPERFLSAIPVGADIEIVRHQLAIRRLNRLIQLQKRALLEQPDVHGLHEVIVEVIRAIEFVRACHEAEAGGNACSVSSRSAARSAADSAFSAADSARSAFSAAFSAADSAFSAAFSARSAFSAAFSAADPAFSAAFSAADLAADLAADSAADLAADLAARSAFSAFLAADSAFSAADSARSAAFSAFLAADSAFSAADSAFSAADSAARSAFSADLAADSAFSAARSARSARSAAWEQESDDLIELLSTLKVAA